MLAEILIAVSLFGAEPVEVPKNVVKWRDQCAASHDAHAEKLASELNAIRESQKKAKSSAQKKEFAKRVKDAEAQLKAYKEGGPTYTLGNMPDQPDVGNLGLVKTVVVVDVLDDSSAIVKRHETGFVGSERRGTPVEYFSVMITGVDTTDWPKKRAVEINGYFEASHVDKATRLVVLQPFDVKKWKAILEEQSKNDAAK